MTAILDSVQKKSKKGKSYSSMSDVLISNDFCVGQNALVPYLIASQLVMVLIEIPTYEKLTIISINSY